MEEEGELYLQGSSVQQEHRSQLKNEQGEGKWETEQGAWVTEAKADEEHVVHDILGVKKRSQSRQEPRQYWPWVVKKSKLEVVGGKVLKKVKSGERQLCLQ